MLFQMNYGRSGKKIFVGDESSGKSLLIARESVWNVDRNARWFRKTGKKRPMVGNFAWSKKFLDYAASRGVEVREWSRLSELPRLRGCDLYIDELATYFDSRNYKDLPLGIRLWLAQAEKLGVQIVGATQDFGQIDKSFRRLCKEVIEVRKKFGSERPMENAPDVRFVWGLCMKYRLSPKSFDGDMVEMKTMGLPKPFLIRRKDIGWFDTSARVSFSEPAPLERIVRHWYDENGKIGHTQTKYI